MRYLALKLIDLYQIFLSPRSGLLMVLGAGGMCKYEISCSEYTKIRIRQVGVVRGLWDGARRVISCR